MTIIGHIKPFVFSQQLVVIDKNEIKEIVSTSMRNLPENICELSHKYNCFKIQIKGSKKYNEGLANKIRKCYIAKFNCNDDLEIEFI